MSFRGLGGVVNWQSVRPFETVSVIIFFIISRRTASYCFILLNFRVVGLKHLLLLWEYIAQKLGHWCHSSRLCAESVLPQIRKYWSVTGCTNKIDLKWIWYQLATCSEQLSIPLKRWSGFRSALCWHGGLQTTCYRHQGTSRPYPWAFVNPIRRPIRKPDHRELKEFQLGMYQQTLHNPVPIPQHTPPLTLTVIHTSPSVKIPPLPSPVSRCILFNTRSTFLLFTTKSCNN